MWVMTAQDSNHKRVINYMVNRRGAFRWLVIQNIDKCIVR